MLGAAGYVDFSVADQSRKRPADEGTRVTRGSDVGIVQHGMAVTTQPPVVAGLGLAEQSNEPLALLQRELPGCIETEALERGAHRLDVNRVVHNGMIDCERAGPCRGHAHHHDFMVD